MKTIFYTAFLLFAIASFGQRRSTRVTVSSVNQQVQTLQALVDGLQARVYLLEQAAKGSGGTTSATYRLPDSISNLPRRVAILEARPIIITGGSTIPDSLQSLPAAIRQFRSDFETEKANTNYVYKQGLAMQKAIDTLPTALTKLRSDFETEKANTNYVYKQGVELKNTVDQLPELTFVGFKVTKTATMVTVTNAPPTALRTRKSRHRKVH